METSEVLHKLKFLSNPASVSGMERFGINPKNTLGVSIPNLRKLAKEIGKDAELARKLWDSGFHEARILASMIDDPKLVTGEQMDRWVKDFDSWDVCDQVCMNLFDKTAVAFDKAREWASRDAEFEKRAGFAMMACLAWHDKDSDDVKFTDFFPLIRRGAVDKRNFVKKAVNWALRQIGKRNSNLNKTAIKTAEEILKMDSKIAKWIAQDAIRELTSSSVRVRLKG